MAHISGPSLVNVLATIGAPESAVENIHLTGIVGEIYEHQVPSHVIEALDRLYGSLYACYRYLKLCEKSGGMPHSWIAHQRGEIVGVMLFRIESERVRVLTEMFMLDDSITAAFCHDVFTRYQDSRIVIFNAITWSAYRLKLPCQYFAYSENYVLSLPDSVQAYESALGKSTRKTLRGYSNRLRRDFPDFEWRSLHAAELSSHVQRTLVWQLQAFKSNSMAIRGKHAQSDAQETARMLAMANECGLYSLGTVNGKLCAGSLACRIGDNYVMLLCASDPAFSSYRLGLLACYWSICDCIQQQALECHLLWGRYRYKEQLLAVPQPLYQLRIYRSRWHMLCSPTSVLTMTGRRLKHYMHSWALALNPLRITIARAMSKIRPVSAQTR